MGPAIETLLVSLKTKYGVLRLQKHDDLLVVAGDAIAGSEELSFRATLAALNTALATLHFRASENYNHLHAGDIQEISVVVSDNSTVPGQTFDTTASCWVFIKPVNDLPSITAPENY